MQLDSILATSLKFSFENLLLLIWILQTEAWWHHYDIFIFWVDKAPSRATEDIITHF